jgi:glycosyltransferase involved in cell wall biosynthesis
MQTESQTSLDAAPCDDRYSAFDATEPPMEVTVLLPCLNEARTVAQCVHLARQVLSQHRLRGEVLVVDNASTDASAELAEAAGARVIREELRGYGHAVRAGIRAAQGRFIIMADADASYDLADIPRFLERLRAGDELVMGNRFQGGIKPHAMPWLNRHLGNPLLSRLGRLLFRCPIRDFHCGMRGFQRDSIRCLKLCSNGMELASEMVAKAALSGQRVSEIATTLSPDGRDRDPHLRPWRDGLRHVRLMLQTWWQRKRQRKQLASPAPAHDEL